MTRLTWSARVLLALVAALTATTAFAQGTRVIAAAPATLGAIPNGTGGQRDVPFSVVDTGITRRVAVSMTMSHPNVGDLTVTLIAPDGTLYYLMGWGTVKPTAALNGVHAFADTATETFVNAVYGPNPVARPGTYLPGFGNQPIDATFDGTPSTGMWTLRVFDAVGFNLVGSITAASLTLEMDPGTTAGADAGTLGVIPDGPSSAPQTPGVPRDVTFTVPAGTGVVQGVTISLTITHGWVGDLVARLIAPDGRQHVLFGYTGAPAVNFGSSIDLAGTYEFSDAALTATSFWSAAASSVTAIPPGTYATSTIGGSASGGQSVAMDPVFAGARASGVWTLRITDGSSIYTGTVTSARLRLAIDATPTTVPDSFTAAYATPLTVAAPGLLANDADNLGGALSATLVTPPAHGSASVSASGAFTYTPQPGFVGTDTFTYRSSNTAGPGAVATVSVLVPLPTTVQPPSGFRASAVNGNTVTVRWTPALGPVATSFLLEGGVTPGQVLASIPTGSPLPIFTFDAPAGAFFLRVRAVANGVVSAPSSETRVFVQTPATPSAPDSLTGVVNGQTVELSWRNTFAGGAPTTQQIVVTGDAVAVLPLPLGETFTFAGVPGGSYTFRVRAVNASGVSADSNAVSLTFPASCTGTPAPPPNFLAYAVGNVVHLLWDPPAAGNDAATSYVITVGGSLNAAVPIVARTISAPLPSGAYTFRVASTNACGTGTSTVTQTVFVP